MNLDDHDRAAVLEISRVIREGVLAKAALEGRIIFVGPGMAGAETVPVVPALAMKSAGSRGRVGDEVVTVPAVTAASKSKFVTTANAASALDTTPRALRKMLRRKARLRDGQLYCDLGIVIARKLGGTRWRFEFRAP